MAIGLYRVFKRKLNTFRRDPLGSSISKIRRWRLGAHSRFSEYQLRKKGYLEFLKQRPANADPPHYNDLWFLYRTVRRRKPSCILEFGSGCSTVILAQALFDNQCESSNNSGYLYSMDSESLWSEVTAKSMPKHLQGLYELWFSPVLEVEFEGTPAFRYSKIPDVTPDLIYLDGPSLTPERQVVVNVLDIEDRLLPGFCLIIDGRVKNTAFFREHLKGRYVFKNRALFANSVFKLVT